MLEMFTWISIVLATVTKSDLSKWQLSFSSIHQCVLTQLSYHVNILCQCYIDLYPCSALAFVTTHTLDSIPVIQGWNK